jgi:hypothetical protein
MRSLQKIAGRRTNCRKTVELAGDVYDATTTGGSAASTVY